MAESRGSQEVTRTSRDAGPYLARMIFVGGWRLAVGGLMMRHQVRSIQHSMQHSELCTPCLSGRADRPRSAGGYECGPAGTLVPT
jgi:hypothetical protein